ncbi:hypothetical protein BH11MYX2_BH11MYX2_38720 [soil metagenome]
MEQTRGTFVGRVETLRTLEGWLQGSLRAKASPSIGSISGSAGIGKTFLLDHALRETALETRRYVVLRVAATSLLPTLAGVVMDLAASAKAGSFKTNDFPRVTECRRALEWMDGRAREEVEREVADDSGLAKTAAELFWLARGLVQFVPLPSAQVVARVANFVEPKHVEAVVRMVQKAVAYQTEKAPRIRGRGDVHLRNQLRNELEKTLASALVEDLERGLVGTWPFHKEETERGRLLLIIDDYERLSEVAGEFLLRHLVPQLAAASFESVIIVLGRDRLVDTHAGWRQHCQPHLLGDIVLAEFSTAEAAQYVRERGIMDAEKVERIVTDTQGCPYLLESEVDDEIHGQSSALSRELFFERTTQWMSAQQKQWAVRIAFLDEISLETIPRVIPNVDPEAVLAWFKREASLRAPVADRWSMRPMIRSKLKEYVRNDSPAKHAELTKAARG